MKPDLVVVGGPSVDTIVRTGKERPVVGGAGFITAVAACVTGARVGLVARTPLELPVAVARGFRPGALLPGGLSVYSGALPGFQIAYDEQDRATYTNVAPGLESELVADDFPSGWLDAKWVHVSPLGGSAEAQLAFVEGLRHRGWSGHLSIGTFLRGIRTERAALLKLAETADLLFLNREEAGALFGTESPSIAGTVFVTCGSDGIVVHRAGAVTPYAAPTVAVCDPTGAGDALCGGVLGAVAQGWTDEVTHGLARAAEVLQGWGVEPLLDKLPDRPEVCIERRDAGGGLAEVDPQQIARVASQLRTVAKASALDFCGFPFPERDEHRTAETLALATLHQYGFWTADAHGYIGPMYATAAGRRWKGSDFIWQAFTRAVRADPEQIAPERLAADPLLFDRICADENGHCPVPDISSHRVLQQGWGRALMDCDGFGALLAAANRADRPVRALLDILSKLPGYGEDPLAKKAALLAIILANRPERFLRRDDLGSVGPIVDYHLMRGCLRTGCVRIIDADAKRSVTDRAWVAPGLEAAIRRAAYTAIEALCDESGLDVAAVDGFFFVNGRSRCVETEQPHCADCPIEEGCAQATELFQPIFRTTAY